MSRVPKIVIDSNYSPCGVSRHITGTDITVTGPNFHHLAHVLRCRLEDKIEVLFPNSQIFSAIVSQIGAQSLSVKLLQEKTTATKDITLICGYPKPATAEVVVEKAVEIGVSSIHFFFADRSQTRLPKEQLNKKFARLEKIKIAALKQSGLVGQMTELYYHDSLKHALNQLVSNDQQSQLRMVFVSPDDDIVGTTSLSNAAEVIQSKRDVASCAIIVGPEGGLCGQEIELAKNHGFIEASLGHKTLRVETAVIASSMLLQLL